MATEGAAVTQLSQDVGDHWTGTTTGAGSVTTLVDTTLINENDDLFVTDRCQIHMLGGAATGESAGVLSKSSATLTVKTNADFSAGTGSGVSYEVHRLFTRKEKVDAINRALETIYPVLFTLKQEDVTIVADQYQYTTTNFTYLNQPSTASLIDSFDTERDTALFAWDMMSENDKLRFDALPAASRVVSLRGIVPPALSEIADLRHLQILSAAASIELYNQTIVSAPSDNISRWRDATTRAEALLKMRIRKHGPVAPAWTLRTDVLSKNARTSSRRA